MTVNNKNNHNNKGQSNTHQEHTSFGSVIVLAELFLASCMANKYNLCSRWTSEGKKRLVGEKERHRIPFLLKVQKSAIKGGC